MIQWIYGRNIPEFERCENDKDDDANLAVIKRENEKLALDEYWLRNLAAEKEFQSAWQAVRQSKKISRLVSLLVRVKNSDWWGQYL